MTLRWSQKEKITAGAESLFEEILPEKFPTLLK